VFPGGTAAGSWR